MKEARKINLETKNKLDKILNEEVKRKTEEAEKEAKKEINTEKTKINQEQNKEISKETIKSKKFLLDLIKKYEDEIFKDIENSLKDFTQTSEYKNYIINSIKNHFEEGDSVKLLLTKKDYIYKEDILNNVNIKSINIIESEKDFIGGFIGIIENKNILIDFSFKSKLEEEKERFNEFKIN